ncbi:hydroxymethylglutaryl-CoA lyase [Alloalcanivorax sp. C16-2]|uniref:hydroxymethylglutaryl-CoA lyase n=1 Tax=Alloalcanivorax sp. C16-2 TaxID=3390052 RepID=UPI003970983A
MDIRINEVGLRDGLQSQGKTLTVEERLKLAEALAGAGLRFMEAGSFVSAKAVPQMAGTEELFPRLPVPERIQYAALVPNMKGYERAVAAGARTVNVVLSVTETMNQKNINMSLARTAEVCEQIVTRAADEGINAQAYLAVAFECPFEGPVAPEVVAHYGERMKDAGAGKVIVADTIGAADPAKVDTVLGLLLKHLEAERLSCHFHDTRGMALANIHAAVLAGVREFDASIGGLGGCPFSPGASGNVATEDVALMLRSMGLETGIDPLDLVPVVREAERLTGTALGGKAFRWLSRQYGKTRGGQGDDQ